MKTFQSALALVALLVEVPSAFAATSALGAGGVAASGTSPITASGASVSTGSSPWYGTGFNSLYVNYFANFHGSPVNDLGNFKTPTTDGVTKKAQPMYFDSTLTTAYRINKDIGVGPEINFNYEPVLGKGFTLKDSGAKIYNKHQFTSGNFNVASNLILQAPTDYSRQSGIDFGVKTTPTIRYDIAATRWTIGSYTEAKAYVGATKGKTFKFWAGPYANYQVSQAVALTATYEMEAHHFAGKPSFDFTNVGTDLQPGVRWNITRDIMLNPYVNLYTGNKITVSNSYVGAIISATVL